MRVVGTAWVTHTCVTSSMLAGCRCCLFDHQLLGVTTATAVCSQGLCHCCSGHSGGAQDDTQYNKCCSMCASMTHAYVVHTVA
jgi:hypothetical protein